MFTSKYLSFGLHLKMFSKTLFISSHNDVCNVGFYNVVKKAGQFKRKRGVRPPRKSQRKLKGEVEMCRNGSDVTRLNEERTSGGTWWTWWWW